MSKQTAKSAYELRTAKILSYMEKLKAELERHGHEFYDSGATNWGYEGDLGYVEEKIRMSMRFLQGEGE